MKTAKYRTKFSIMSVMIHTFYADVFYGVFFLYKIYIVFDMLQSGLCNVFDFSLPVGSRV